MYSIKHAYVFVLSSTKRNIAARCESWYTYVALWGTRYIAVRSHRYLPHAVLRHVTTIVTNVNILYSANITN